MLQIRSASYSDIPQLQELHSKWLSQNMSNKEKTNGFLSCDEYNFDDFEKIIKANEMVIAQLQGEIIGYYLFDNYSQTPDLTMNKQIINALQQKGLLAFEKISNRAQAVVEKQHQKLGLSKLMLAILLEQTKGKYDVLFSVVMKNNPKLIAHLSSGWEIVGEDIDKVYVYYLL